MGSTKEASDYKKESELNKSQPNYFATAIYHDGTEVKVEGININGKTKIKNAHLKTKKGQGPLVPSNIRLKSVERITFSGNEGTSIIATVRYKSGKDLDYLFDSGAKFGGWIEGTERSSTCTLEIGKLKELVVHGPKTMSHSKARQHREAKEVMEADKDEPLDEAVEIDPEGDHTVKKRLGKKKSKKGGFSLLG